MGKLIFICNFVHSQQQKSEPALKRMEPVDMDILGVLFNLHNNLLRLTWVYSSLNPSHLAPVAGAPCVTPTVNG